MAVVGEKKSTGLKKGEGELMFSFVFGKGKKRGEKEKKMAPTCPPMPLRGRVDNGNGEEKVRTMDHYTKGCNKYKGEGGGWDPFVNVQWEEGGV